MRLIDADKIPKAIYAEEDNLTGSGMCEVEMEIYNDGIDAQWEKIEKAPTVDAVEVVRCKDCRYYIPYSDHCGMHQIDMNTDDYCSYGERGEADDET